MVNNYLMHPRIYVKLNSQKMNVTKFCVKMPSGKSPGNDGLTKEFYDKFWDLISDPLLVSPNYSYENKKII